MGHAKDLPQALTGPVVAARPAVRRARRPRAGQALPATAAPQQVVPQQVVPRRTRRSAAMVYWRERSSVTTQTPPQETAVAPPAASRFIGAATTRNPAVALRYVAMVSCS